MTAPGRMRCAIDNPAAKQRNPHPSGYFKVTEGQVIRPIAELPEQVDPIARTRRRANTSSNVEISLHICQRIKHPDPARPRHLEEPAKILRQLRSHEPPSPVSNQTKPRETRPYYQPVHLQIGHPQRTERSVDAIPRESLQVNYFHQYAEYPRGHWPAVQSQVRPIRIRYRRAFRAVSDLLRKDTFGPWSKKYRPTQRSRWAILKCVRARPMARRLHTGTTR